MRRLRHVAKHLVPAVVACFLAATRAEAAAPDGGTSQLFGGFSYARSDRLPEHTFRGYMGGFSWAQNRWVRWTFENGGQWGPSNFRWIQPVAGTNREITFDLGQSLFQVEGGPEFTFRKGRAILFAHALPGYGVWALENSGWFWKGGDRESGFSLAIGGGVDVRLARHFGLRLIQVDYTPLWQGAGNPEPFVVPSVPPGQSLYHNFRLGFGVIFSSAK